MKKQPLALAFGQATTRNQSLRARQTQIPILELMRPIFFITPRPFSRAWARLNCAGALPCCAAFRFQSAAFAGLAGMPRPRSRMKARFRCASAWPCRPLSRSREELGSSQEERRARRDKFCPIHIGRAHILFRRQFEPVNCLLATGLYVHAKLVA